MPFNSFEDMSVWKKGMDLAEKIHLMTEELPKKEDYGLTSRSEDPHCQFLETSQRDLAGNTQRTN